MSVWVLVQVVLNVLCLLGFAIIWLRLKKPAKDDPRLSRGLQLLQSKITVLEDLSDRTDRQVNQLTGLLDQKIRLLQTKIIDAETQIQKVQGSMDRSLEVAEIFQDKIPHDEIIDRQNTVKYIQAARMAHSGSSVDEIMKEVKLPREQVEFIAKVNKDKLMFDDERLPAWAGKTNDFQEELEVKGSAREASENVNGFLDEADEAITVDQYVQQYNIDPAAFELPKEKYDSLKRLGDEFRQVCDTYETEPEAELLKGNETSEQGESQSQIYKAARQVTKKLVDGVSEFIHEPFHKEDPSASAASVVTESVQPNQGDNVPAATATAPAGAIVKKQEEKPKIQKVVFPRIDM